MHLLLTSASLFLTLAAEAAHGGDSFCGEPPEIRFASITDASSDTFPIGTTVTYGCQLGYVTSGKSRKLSCVESENSAKWTEQQFSCIPQSCGDPGFLPNSHRIGSLFTFPNSVTFECDPGYNIQGIATRYCLASGTWSGRLPLCNVVTCDPPTDPVDGHVTAPSLEYGSELNYKCNQGFSLSTEEKVYCTENGTWSRSDVTCNETVCEVPKAPEYGKVRLSGSDVRPRAESIAFFSCDGNRVISGSATSKCLSTGEWNFPSPECLEPCRVEVVSNGKIGKYVRSRSSRQTYFQVFQPGQRVEDFEDFYLRCSDKFEVSGTRHRESKVHCYKGKWSQQLLCDPAACRSRPASTTTAEIVDVKIEHGGTVEYRCFPDYRKIVDETVICDYGKWKGNPPTCKNTNCSVNTLTPFGLVRGSKQTYRNGDVFEVKCEARYQLAEGNGGQIRCQDGTWKVDFPPCIAESCSDHPPTIEHGRAEFHSMEHGTEVKYVCRDPYVLVQESRVQCSFGKWVGKPPSCRESGCQLQDLKNLDHVSRTSPSFTLSGRRLNITCNYGYSAEKHLPMCRNGAWVSNRAPLCKESRCQLQDLKNLNHVSRASPSFTLSGSRANITCNYGYSAEKHLPLCSNGAWDSNRAPLCKESGCEIPEIRFGFIAQERFGDFFWNGYRYLRRLNYKIIPSGSRASSGTVLWFFCDEPHSVHGRGEWRKEIRCSKGRWSTDLQCLRAGERYVPSTEAPLSTHLASTTEPSPSSSMTTVQFVPPSATPSSDATELTSPINIEKIKSEEVITLYTTTETPKEECFCEYSVEDDRVIAHAEGKRLIFGDRVRKGSSAIFRCRLEGYDRFRGQREIACSDCMPWHSSEMPSCTSPNRGDAVILLNNDVTVLPNGDIEIPKGQRLNLTCAAMEIATFPTWSAPVVSGMSFINDSKVRESFGDVVYFTYLEIQNAAYDMEGSYECSINGEHKNTIHVKITDPNLRCPEFPEDDEIIIEYEMGRGEGSSVEFSCSNKDQELVGKPILTCLRNGEWSDSPPRCSGTKCEQLKASDFLRIEYRGDRAVGSLAVFHCANPGRRNGVSHTQCLENGSWDDPTPTCDVPHCPMSDLRSSAPENAVLQQDNATITSLPYNSTVNLICDDMILEGNPVAKCGEEGKWAIDMKCVLNCSPLPKTPGSKLILSQEKNSYKFGDRLDFSCPPGMHLTSQIQVIMCLRSGWSEKKLPDCAEPNTDKEQARY